ncbi:MAG: hypothetical protein ACI4DU_06515 [Lachnospiraceae bacterium]
MQPARSTAPKPQKKKKNVEFAFGKNIMGILASLLIFAGLIILVRATYESFTDIMKIIGIFCLSGCILAVGLIGKSKSKNNAFFISLTGCGAGAIYLSLFLTYSYFGYINVYVLFLLLTIWSVIVTFLGGKDSPVFKIIGQCGMLAMLFFGTATLDKTVEPNEILATYFTLLGAYILLSGFYFLLEKKNGVARNLPSLILAFIGLIFLWINSVSLLDKGIYSQYADGEIARLSTILVATIIVTAYGSFLLYLFQKKIEQPLNNVSSTVGWCIYFSFVFLTNCIGINVLQPYSAYGEDYWGMGIVGLLFCGFFFFLVEKRGKRDAARIITVNMIYLAMACYAGNLGLLSEMFSTGLLVIPYLAYGLFRKDRLCLALGFCSQLIFLFTPCEYEAVYSSVGFLFLLMTAVVLLYGKSTYHVVLKICFYVLVQVYLIEIARLVNEVTLIEKNNLVIFAYAASVILCYLARFTPFAKEWVSFAKEEKAVRIFLYIINAILMINGCIFMFIKIDAVIRVICVLFALAAFFFDIPRLMKQYPSHFLCSFYIGMKLTIFVICVLEAFEAVGYLVGMGCFLLAVACIAIGFIGKYKYIRLYGLILALVSILKIVLFDVKYDSTITKAIVVIACGIIAFVISFIYNVVDKKIHQEEKRENDRQSDR